MQSYITQIKAEFNGRFRPVMPEGETLLAWSVDGPDAREFMLAKIKEAIRQALVECRPEDRTDKDKKGQWNRNISGYNSALADFDKRAEAILTSLDNK